MFKDSSLLTFVCINKKAELSQRWPRDATYIPLPLKFSGVPQLLHSRLLFAKIFNGLLFSNWSYEYAYKIFTNGQTADYMQSHNRALRSIVW